MKTKKKTTGRYERVGTMPKVGDKARCLSYSHEPVEITQIVGEQVYAIGKTGTDGKETFWARKSQFKEREGTGVPCRVLKRRKTKKKTSAGPKVWVSKAVGLVYVVTDSGSAYNAIHGDGEICGAWCKGEPKAGAMGYISKPYRNFKPVTGKRRAGYLKFKDSRGDTWQTAR